jgi:hypothetical protein
VIPGHRDRSGHSRLTFSLKEHPMFNFNKQRATSERRPTLRRPRLEALEGRVVLSTFHVNTLADTVAVNPITAGKDSTGHISLRSAVQAADANPKASDTIVLPAGTFTLTRGEVSILVDDHLTIEGSTKGGQTIISGNNHDRVFLTLSGNVAMSNLVIEHGSVVGQGIAQGGGLLNDGAAVTLTSVQFFDNTVSGGNGATGAAGTTDGGVGTAGGAGGAGTNAEGGAICNLGPSLTLIGCFMNTNQANGGDGGPGGPGGAGFGGTIDRNGLAGVGGAGGAGGAAGTGEGGGVFNGLHARLVLSGDTFSKNEAFGGSAGIGGAGGIGQGGNGGNGTNGNGSAGGGGGAIGGAGGAGGLGGLGAGGGIYNGGGQITLVGSTTTFTSNEAGGGTGGPGGKGGNGIGASGGNGAQNDPGGPAGETKGGVGGNGGQGGNGEGGAIFNAAGGSISSTTAVLVSSNSARGAPGGNGGNGGAASTGTGGNGGPSGSGGASGNAGGANAGNGADGGVGEGGGLFNAAGGTITFKAGVNTSSPPVSTFSMNLTVGGSGGNGGNGGSATAGNGGNGGNGSALGTTGGNGGSATSGSGGSGGLGDVGVGGGLLDAGTASFTGVTVDFTNNQATGGSAGNGGNGGADAIGGTGGFGLGARGGNGGNATGGNGGNAGAISGIGSGGGIAVDPSGTLVLKPRLGARRGSKQAHAIDFITSNSATPGGPGAAGLPGAFVLNGFGGPGSPDGNHGTFTVGQPGKVLAVKQSFAGGIAIFGTGKATADNTSVTGNSAITDPNIEGTLST